MKLTFITAIESSGHDRIRRKLSLRRKRLADLRHDILRTMLAKGVRVGELAQDPDKLSKKIEALDKKSAEHAEAGIGRVYVKDGGSHVTIYPFAQQFHSITVYKPERSPAYAHKDKVRPAYVSWPSFHCDSVDAAEVFGLCVVYAAKMARDLNRRAGL